MGESENIGGKNMIELFTDHYFHIGNAHLGSGKPCQDYAISSIYNGAAFAVVSDGCSTGRHTDVGSRLVSLSTLSAIRDHWITRRSIDVNYSPAEIAVEQRVVLASMRDALGLISDDMLATCVYAYITPSGGIVHVQGDGVVAVKYRDGRIVMRNFEWLDNMPYYSAYKNGSAQSFIDAHGGDLHGVRLKEEVWVSVSDSEYRSVDLVEHSLSAGMRGITINIDADDIEEYIEFIAVFSDGVTQIDGVRWHDAVGDFLAFKNTKGDFAKRRMIRGIKDAGKIGKGPFDDISYAVVRVNAILEEDDYNDKVEL